MNYTTRSAITLFRLVHLQTGYENNVFGSSPQRIRIGGREGRGHAADHTRTSSVLPSAPEMLTCDATTPAGAAALAPAVPVHPACCWTPADRDRPLWGTALQVSGIVNGAQQQAIVVFRPEILSERTADRPIGTLYKASRSG